MWKKVKTTKFKVLDAEINKKLVGDVFVMQKIKPNGGHGDIGRKPGTKNRMTLDKLAKIVADGFAKQAKFNTRIEKVVLNLRHDVTSLRCDVVNLKNNVTSLGTRIDNLVKVNSLKE